MKNAKAEIKTSIKRSSPSPRKWSGEKQETKCNKTSAREVRPLNDKNDKNKRELDEDVINEIIQGNFH